MMICCDVSIPDFLLHDRRLGVDDDLDKLFALVPVNSSASGKKNYTMGPVTLRQVRL